MGCCCWCLPATRSFFLRSACIALCQPFIGWMQKCSTNSHIDRQRRQREFRKKTCLSFSSLSSSLYLFNSLYLYNLFIYCCLYTIFSLLQKSLFFLQWIFAPFSHSKLTNPMPMHCVCVCAREGVNETAHDMQLRKKEVLRNSYFLHIHAIRLIDKYSNFIAERNGDGVMLVFVLPFLRFSNII